MACDSPEEKSYRFIYLMDSIVDHKIPYFKIVGSSKFAKIIMPGYKCKRDFNRIKEYIPDIACLASELIKDEYEVGFIDPSGSGRIIVSDYLGIDAGVTLCTYEKGKMSVDIRHTLESAITSILHILTGSKDTLKSNYSKFIKTESSPCYDDLCLDL